MTLLTLLVLCVTPIGLFRCWLLRVALKYVGFLSANRYHKSTREVIDSTSEHLWPLSTSFMREIGTSGALSGAKACPRTPLLVGST